MQEPIGVKVDPDVEAGYVVDYDDANHVVGIEILAFDEPALTVAHAVAAGHGLAFPRDIVWRRSIRRGRGS